MKAQPNISEVVRHLPGKRTKDEMLQLKASIGGLKIENSRGEKKKKAYLHNNESMVLLTIFAIT